MYCLSPHITQQIVEYGDGIRNNDTRFVDKICTIERELAFAGKVIDDDDKKYALLNGLRDEYAIKKAILHESYGTSFAKMISSLEITENELKTNEKSNSGSSSSGSSFYAGRLPRNDGKVCYICERPDHIMNECFFNPRSKKYKSKLEPSARILANLKKRKMLNVSSTNHANDQCDFLFMASDGTINDKWLLDSCCTRHITNKRKNMMHYRRMNGNGSINAACQDEEMKIVGIGNIRVQQTIDGKKVVSMLKDVAYVPSCRTNLIALTLAQQRGLDVRYKGGGTNKVTTYKGKIATIGDSK